MEYSNQLEIFARLQTPEWKAGQANDTRDELCYVYCRIRNFAKDVLAGFTPLNGKSKSQLISLLQKANKLNNETIFSI